MAKCRKQFDGIPYEDCVSVLDYDNDCFVPELSMPVKDILMQFGYMDNMRLREMMQHGYSMADDDTDFDAPEIDGMDIAEKRDLYERSHVTVKSYLKKLKEHKKKQQTAEKAEE